MIESIRIQNYKALRDVTLHLTPIHVLIGKNDSGKTSILEAITALCRSVDYPLANAFQGRWSGWELVTGSNPQLAVTIEAILSDVHEKVQYLLSCVFQYQRQCAAVQEIVDKKFPFNNPMRPTTEVHDFSKSPSVNNELERLFATIYFGLSGVRACRWSARMLSLPVAFDGDGRPFEQSDSGFGLALALDDILGANRERFVQLESQFRSIFPQVTSIKLVREPGYRLPPDDPENVPQLQNGSGKGIRFDFDNGMSNVPASQVSDGLLIVLGYLATLYSTQPPRVLLIEEPENGVHPERLAEVIKLIREIIAQHPRTQVVLTTHSPYVIDHFSPSEVTLCHKSKDGSVTLHKLSEIPKVQKQSSIFTLGEIWTGEGDDELAQSTAAEGAAR